MKEVKIYTMEIKTDLKKITGEFQSLSKPGKDCDTDVKDVTALSSFAAFKKVCEKEGEYDNKDMAAVAALLCEMQIKENVPDEYTELSERFSELVKQNKKLDVSESRDYVFFAYECMRELEKLDNRAYCELSDENANVYALASQDDDISCIVVVNNSGEEVLADIEISGLPGRSTSIDYYYADEFEQLSIACNTDTKLETTKIMIPMPSYSLHLFKIR